MSGKNKLSALMVGRKTNLQWSKPWKDKNLLEARRSKNREEGGAPPSPGKKN
jgi:hypothetical protein